MNHAAIEAAARARYEMHNPPGKYQTPTWESLHKVDRTAMLKEAAVMIQASRACEGQPMNPHDILKQAGELIGERGADYGGIEKNFERIALIASAATGITITPHQACMVLVATKLSRMAGSRDKADNYLDAINYLAFAHELRGDK